MMTEQKQAWFYSHAAEEEALEYMSQRQVDDHNLHAGWFSLWPEHCKPHCLALLRTGKRCFNSGQENGFCRVHQPVNDLDERNTVSA